MKLIITGGAGFIGSNFIRYMLNKYPDYEIANIDKLTYSGNLDSLEDIEKDPRYKFIKCDICDKKKIDEIFSQEKPDYVVHFAAESHVDRSIADPETFTKTNMLGTRVLLEAARKINIRKFLHISTDEVFGSIQKGKFKETDALFPNSPYAASKAGADMLARSYFKTFSLPVLITRTTNNFGPYQFPEKLMPLFITNLIEGKKVPVYGKGKNIREWIYVLDNCEALDVVLHKGKIGEIYNIGSGEEKTNMEITKFILKEFKKGASQVEFVQDRPGHDFRYALDTAKIKKMGWKPKYTFEKAMSETIKWYIENEWWWKKLRSGKFSEYYNKQYKK